MIIMEKIKLLLVDDQTLFVESLRIVLNVLAREIVVTGVASNGQEALELVEREDPDVVLLDVRMPVMDGVECVKEIRSKFPNVKVLMLTTFDDDQYVAEALESGAAGYLLKDVPPPDLIAAVRAVHQGGVMLSPKVATKLVELAQTGGDAGANRQQSGPSWLNELNNREKEILRLLAQGFENREIAHQLYIAEQTVKNYVSIIYCKMGVRDRVHATRLAIEAKLV
jgi:DNA-binding NarL/FixJ family response regulator